MSQKFRSFTVRLPVERYLEIGTLAQAEGMNLNQKVGQLVDLGLGKHVEIDAAVRRLILGAVIDGAS